MCAATMRPRLPAPRISQISSSNPGESGLHKGKKRTYIYIKKIALVRSPAAIQERAVRGLVYIYYTKSAYLLYKFQRMFPLR